MTLSAEQLAQALTEIWRTPTGTMALRPLQGVLLMRALPTEQRPLAGAWSQLSVGIGKTLCAALLMSLIGGERPLVLTSASIIPQMKADFERFRLHFQLPSNYRLEAYEKLSSLAGRALLDDLNPTCVILDEGHKLKAVEDAGRAMLFDTWRYAHWDVPVCNLSGSPGKEFAVYAHTLIWVCPHLAENNGGRIPVDSDGRPRGIRFKEFCAELKSNPQFHDEFWQWLRAQPGVLISSETFTEKPIHIEHVLLPTPPEMEEHWARLRDFGEAPDEWLLEGPGEQWCLARCLANNMYYEHDPRPPKPFLEARKEWLSYARNVIHWKDAPGGPYYTNGQVALAVTSGPLTDGKELLRRWLEIRPTYNPVTTTRWLSTAALDFAHEWGIRNGALSGKHSGGSIVWVEQTGVGEALARKTGWPYYGDGGKNARRQHVRNATAPVIICSVKSCGTGNNLQHRYSRGLWMSPPSNDELAEQTLGRTHRSGQPEDCVHATFLYGCLEDWMGAQKAENEAVTAEEDLTAPRKLQLAVHTRARYPEAGTSMAWEKSTAVVVVVPEK